MDRLKHTGVTALRIYVAGGRDAQATSQSRSKVAQDIGMQIGSHQGIQGRRAVDHTRSGSVYQFFVPLDIWKFFADLHGDFIPHHHGMALGVRLGHYRQQFTRTRLR